MPEFFLPHSESPEQAEEVLMSIRKFAHDNTGRDIGPRRIYRLRYRHDGNTYEARVGETDEVEREPVFAILDAGDMYLIITPNRGVLRGFPILVGKPHALDVEDFDSAPAP